MKKFLTMLTAFMVMTGIASAKDETVLDTVIVTSQKTEEKVQDVPISMSVFSDVDIDDRMLDNVADISKYTPGLYTVDYSTPGKFAPSMRGFASDYFSDASVGLYVDGVPIVDMGSFDETLMDVERVEVLRGPQGTLYGKNTEVGVINVITKKPDNTTRGVVRIKAGEDNKQEVSFTTSGAIAKDKLYLSVSGRHYEKDGFMTNSNTGDTVDDREHNYGKVYLRWTPTKKLDTSLIVTRLKHNSGAARTDYTYDKGHEVSNDLESTYTPETTAASLQINYQITDNLKFSSLTTNRIYKENGYQDFDFTDNPKWMFHQRTYKNYNTLSQEFRTNLKLKRINLVSGIYLEKKDYRMNKTQEMFSKTKHQKTREEYKSIGLFTHLTYDITKKLSLITGIRYDKDDREIKSLLNNTSSDNDWSEVSPKIALRYKPKENLTTYATVSKGYLAGGFNSRLNSPTSFDKETLWNYEVGVKGSAFENKMMYDVALYYMDISDMQVNIYPDPTSSYVANAAEAKSQGIEASLTAKVSKNLKLFTGFSYNDATFDKYKDSLGSYNGNDTVYSPKYNFSTGFVYRSDRGFYSSFDVTAYGKSYIDRENKYPIDPYELLNGKIGYEAENFDIYFYGKNILDKEYDADGDFGGTYTAYSKPRELGMEIAYRF